jgi:folate-binding protein YgfZ
VQLFLAIRLSATTRKTALNKNETLNDYSTLLKVGAGFCEEAISTVTVIGADARDFLQRMTSQDWRKVANGQSAGCLLINPNGLLLFAFAGLNIAEQFNLLINSSESSGLAEALEKFHFTEDLEIKNLQQDFKFIRLILKTALVGSTSAELALLAISPNIISKLMGEKNKLEPGNFFVKNDFGYELLILREEDLLAKENYLFRVSAAHFDEFIAKLQAVGARQLAFDTFELLKFEAGDFKLGRDISERCLVLEAPLDNSVSRNKGCYPGQEVVERIFTYSQVAKKLVGFRFDKNQLESKIAKQKKLWLDSKEVGDITFMGELPWSGEVLGRAVVKKPHYISGQKLFSDAENQNAIEVFELPNTFKISED